jgi:hypothetical protein
MAKDKVIKGKGLKQGMMKVGEIRKIEAEKE